MMESNCCTSSPKYFPRRRLPMSKLTLNSVFFGRGDKNDGIRFELYVRSDYRWRLYLRISIFKVGYRTQHFILDDVDKIQSLGGVIGGLGGTESTRLHFYPKDGEDIRLTMTRCDHGKATILLTQAPLVEQITIEQSDFSVFSFAMLRINSIIYSLESLMEASVRAARHEKTINM